MGIIEHVGLESSCQDLDVKVFGEIKSITQLLQSSPELWRELWINGGGEKAAETVQSEMQR